MQYDRDPKDLHELDIKALDQENDRKMYEELHEDKRQTLDMDFGDKSDKFQREYLDKY